MNKITNTPNVKKLITIEEVKPVRKTNGKRNKVAGTNFEREVVNTLKEMGFPHLSSTRLESRARDAQKIDVMNKNEHINGRFRYNLQCKNVVGALKYAKVLSELPKDGSGINVVLHNQTARCGTRFITKDQFAFLNMSDFFLLIQEIEALKGQLKALGNTQ